MTTYELVLHYMDTDRTTSLYAQVDRNWPSVPPAGTFVSLGGGDQQVMEVKFVEFMDGKVRLHFAPNFQDITRTELKDLGFKPAD